MDVDLVGSVFVANTLRAIPITLGAILWGMSLRIVFLYFKAYRRELGLRERRADGHHRGLLPLHVMAISLSYVLVIAYAVVALVGNVGQPLNLLEYVLATSATLSGLFALLVILRYERRRVVLASMRGGRDAAAPPPTGKPRRVEAAEDVRDVGGLISRGVMILALVVIAVATLVAHGRLLDISLRQQTNLQHALEHLEEAHDEQTQTLIDALSD